MTEAPCAPAPAAASPTTDWRQLVLPYQRPSVGKAVWQLANTLLPLAGIWAAIYALRAGPWWPLVALSALGGLFLVRVFIIFHDCGHGSFLPSRRANDILGFVTGLLTFTPYHQWRHSHSVHHANSGDLDRRGVGDIWTMTVREYVDSTPRKRLLYRVSRNPFFLFGLAPLIVFLFKQRFPEAGAQARERRSVLWMNVAVVALAAGLIAVFGLRTYLLVQLTMISVAGAAGFWLFYVQHQFEGVYWGRGEQWDHVAAALQGSSFYRLPAVLQWFSGNIGYHHVHHLSSRIPNYNLQRCHESHPLFRDVPELTLATSLKSLYLHLWDEERGELVGYRRARSRATA